MVANYSHTGYTAWVKGAPGNLQTIVLSSYSHNALLMLPVWQHQFILINYCSINTKWLCFIRRENLCTSFLWIFHRPFCWRVLSRNGVANIMAAQHPKLFLFPVYLMQVRKRLNYIHYIVSSAYSLISLLPLQPKTPNDRCNC